MTWFPFILLGVTIALVIPSRFLKKRYQKYTERMKEFIWVDNFTDITKGALKTKMVEIDEEIGTTQVREESYNFFVEQFVESLLSDLNNATISNAKKIEKIQKAQTLFEMNFDVPALSKLEESKNKLRGNVKI